MKTQDLINAFGDIDEEFFAECADTSAMDGSVDLIGSRPQKIRIYKEPLRIRARRYAVSAAVIICALAVGAAAGAHFTSARIQSTPNSNNSENSASIIQSTSPLDQNISNIPIPNSKYTYLTLDEIREQAKELVKHFFGDDFDFDDPNNYEYFEYDQTVNPDRDNCILFHNNGSNPDLYDGAVICYHENGMLFLSSSLGFEGVEYAHPEMEEIEKLYQLNMGDELDGASYRMTDGQEWSVADAAAYSLDLANTYFAALENYDFTYEVTDLSVRKPGSNYGYVVNMQRVDKNGNLYDNHSEYSNRDTRFDTDKTFRYNTDSWLVEGNPYLYESGVQIKFIKKDMPLGFVRSAFPYSSSVLNSGEKLISLEEAIEIITKAPRRGNEHFPAFEGKLEFSTAELEYYSVCTGVPEYTGPDYVGPLTYPHQLQYSEYAQLRPYWPFTPADNYAPYSTEVWLSIPHHYGLYLVDAVTGELHVI